MKNKIFTLSGISLIGIFSFYLLFLFVNSKYEEHKNTEREESIFEQKKK